VSVPLTNLPSPTAQALFSQGQVAKTTVGGEVVEWGVRFSSSDETHLQAF
jgi:hypothetical protein